MPIATTTTTTPATSPTSSTATTTTRYQSSVAPHFPMKTMLTPRSSSGPLTTSSASSSSKSAPLIKTHDPAYSYSGGLLDANGSMAAAFAMSTVPGSSSNAATVVCKVPKFLRSLYAILQTEDPAVISWVENRELKPNRVTAFHILAMDRFEREVLPKYFKHQKFASFQRQLNNFGFRKWTKTQSSGVCTFSHNSFPPDPTATGGVLRASFREQWRQKSPLTASSPSLTVHAAHHQQQQPPRRRVGNGITKADRKSSSRRNAAAVSAVRVDLPPTTESFMDLYKSPLNAAAVMMSDGRSQQPYMPSHQPATKKLARPLHELSGLEAFCDDTYKQFILPPLQPHHLLATTPRSMYATLSDAGEPTTPSLGGFPHARSLNAADYNNLKPYDYPEKPTSGGHHNAQTHTHSQSMDASFTGAFLEPWSWDAANMNSALELSAFPLDFDWQDAQQQQHMAAQQQQQQQMAQVSVSVGVAPLHHHQSHQQHQHPSKDAFCHPQDSRMATSAEEFGFETFLFAE